MFYFTCDAASTSLLFRIPTMYALLFSSSVKESSILSGGTKHFSVV